MVFYFCIMCDVKGDLNMFICQFILDMYIYTFILALLVKII